MKNDKWGECEISIVCETQRKRKREMRQGRQGTYTEVTATLFPFPPLLYEHREDIRTEPQVHKKCGHTYSTHTEQGGEEEGGERRLDGLTHDERTGVRIEGSTQSEMGRHSEVRKERNIKRRSDRERESVRHQKQQWRWRETLTTDTGGDWCQNNVI